MEDKDGQDRAKDWAHKEFADTLRGLMEQMCRVTRGHGDPTRMCRSIVDAAQQLTNWKGHFYRPSVGEMQEALPHWRIPFGAPDHPWHERDFDSALDAALKLLATRFGGDSFGHADQAKDDLRRWAESFADRHRKPSTQSFVVRAESKSRQHLFGPFSDYAAAKAVMESRVGGRFGRTFAISVDTLELPVNTG